MIPERVLEYLETCPRLEYAEAHSIAEVNHRAGDGWTVHTAGTLPSGDRWYLMQREKT